MKSKKRSSEDGKKSGKSRWAQLNFMIPRTEGLASFKMEVITDNGKRQTNRGFMFYKDLVPEGTPPNQRKSLVVKALNNELNMTNEGQLPTISYDGSEIAEGTILMMKVESNGLSMSGFCGGSDLLTDLMTEHGAKVLSSIRKAVLSVIEAEEALKVPESLVKKLDITFKY